MTVLPLAVDVPPDVDAASSRRVAPGATDAFASAVGEAFARASGALERAAGAERAFVSGRGGLQEMVLERAQADIALQIASTAASRASQALSTILGMQV